MQDWHGSKPTALSGYLEAMVRSIFTAGINWKVVEAKWNGIREAFEEFDVEKVAALAPADVDRLAGDTRVIRNRRKLEAVIKNAGVFLDRAGEHESFHTYLTQLGAGADLEVAADGLAQSFAHLGRTSALFFLFSAGWRAHDLSES